MYMTLFQNLSLRDRFYWGKNLLSHNCSCRNTPKKFWFFFNFSKNQIFQRNKICTILLNVLHTIQQQNLIKNHFYLIFWKCRRGLPPKISVSNSRVRDISHMDWGISVLEKNGWTVYPLVLFTDRLTFCRQSIFRYQGPTKHGFWLHHVLEDFFLNLATGFIHFFAPRSL